MSCFDAGSRSWHSAMSCVALHIPGVATSMLGYSLATFPRQQLLPNAVSCDIRALAGSWAVTAESLPSWKARLPRVPRCCGQRGGQWPRQLQPVPICAARPPEAPARAEPGQEQGEAFVLNWAMLTPEQPHLLWGKGLAEASSRLDVMSQATLNYISLDFIYCALLKP